MAGKGDGIIIWSGAGTTGGDAHIQSGKVSGGIKIMTVGFNQDGAANGNVYLWNGASWIDTTQTVAGFFGV